MIHMCILIAYEVFGLKEGIIFEQSLCGGRLTVGDGSYHRVAF